MAIDPTQVTICATCGKQLDLGLGALVGLRDDCPFCRAPLHACGNCIAYDASMRYGCRELQAEPPRSKDDANVCEFFTYRRGEGAPKDESPKASALAALEALFKKK